MNICMYIILVDRSVSRIFNGGRKTDLLADNNHDFFYKYQLIT